MKGTGLFLYMMCVYLPQGALIKTSGIKVDNLDSEIIHFNLISGF